MHELSPTRPLAWAGHVCAFVEGVDEAAAALAPVARDALLAGERVLALGGSASLERLCHGLDALRLGARQCAGCGQLRLVPWLQVADPARPFDADATLAALESVLGDALEHASQGLRVVADMDWVVSAAGGGPELARYERRVDGLMRAQRQPTLCVYDLTRISGPSLMQILSCHRHAFLHGRLVESPFYVEPR